MSMTSSAKRLILCSSPATEIPVMLGWDLMLSANGSIRCVKMIGDRGHPCFVPFVICIGLEVMPELRTMANGVE